MTVQTSESTRRAKRPVRRASRAALVIGASAILVLSVAGLAQAGDHKVTICHFTSSSTNPFVAITIDESASTFPHLDSNGSPLNGHEQDFLLPFDATAQDCEDAANPPTPTPTPAGTTPPTATPTPTPTPEGTQLGGTGTPVPSVPNTAMSLGGSAPLATLLFGGVLLASLGTLAFANVRAARRRR